MRYLALLALLMVPAGAAGSESIAPLRALTEADVGADALKNSACYAHSGAAVLLVATKKNAVVNADGDLLLLRARGGSPSDGARYLANQVKVTVSPVDDTVESADGRTDRAALIEIEKGGSTKSIAGRWSCGTSKSA